MKKWLLAAGTAVIFILAGCSAGIVATRPADVVYSRTPSPGPGYIWMGGDWIWSGGSYRWHEGRWARPRAGRAWNEGHWEHRGRGYQWRKGHW